MLQSQAQILLLLKELQTEFDMGLVLITHDLGVVARIATRVAVMYAGQIVEEGTAQQIFENPLHPYTRGLMGCIPVPGKTKRGEPLGSIPGMVPSLIGSTGCAGLPIVAFWPKPFVGNLISGFEIPKQNSGLSLCA